MVTMADARAFAATLPRTTEGVVRGRLKCRIGQIVYLDFSRDETIMGFAFPKEWRETLVGSEPGKFLMPRQSDLRYNWVCVRLDAIDEEEMRELVLDAWAIVVPKRVAAAYGAELTRTAARPSPAELAAKVAARGPAEPGQPSEGSVRSLRESGE